jgi:hypothetical protein
VVTYPRLKCDPGKPPGRRPLLGGGHQRPAGAAPLYRAIDGKLPDVSIHLPGEVLTLGQAHHAHDLAIEQGDQHGMPLFAGRCQGRFDPLPDGGGDLGRVTPGRDPDDQPGTEVQQSWIVLWAGEEMTGHLGYDKHDPAGRGSGDNRNGTTGKTVLTDAGAVGLAVPRDRNGTFEPQIVRKGQTRLEGFNGRITALYARGMTTRGIRASARSSTALVTWDSTPSGPGSSTPPARALPSS